mmetsp:Transcript_27676/g.61024  ORF Transcript_27676/g.61024 Transcript_27676/m.61024 type:complete len:237 (+) Transcript_27676:956-1666(+)
MKLCCTVALAKTSWAMASMRVGRISLLSRQAKSCEYSVSNLSRVSLLRMALTDLTVFSTSDTSRLGLQPPDVGLLPLEPPSAWLPPWLLFPVAVLLTARSGVVVGEGVRACPSFGPLEASFLGDSFAPLESFSFLRWPSKTMPSSANAEPAMVAPTHFTREGGGARPAICCDMKSQKSISVWFSASPTTPSAALRTSAATTTVSTPQPAAMRAPARAAPRGRGCGRHIPRRLVAGR